MARNFSSLKVKSESLEKELGESRKLIRDMKALVEEKERLVKTAKQDCRNEISFYAVMVERLLKETENTHQTMRLEFTSSIASLAKSKREADITIVE